MRDAERPSLSFDELLGGPVVTILDVSCRPRHGACGGEEHAGGDEIVFLRSGLFVKHMGTRRVLADPNHVVFFNRGEPYRVSHPEAAGDACTVLRFAGGVLRDAWADVPGSRGRAGAPRFGLTHCPIDAEMSLALHRLRRQALGMAGRDPLALEEAALDVLASVARAAARRGAARPAPPARPQTRSRRREMVEAARLLLAARPAEPLSLEGIARRVGGSPYHLARVFREETGLPVHRYRSRLRLREALQRLTEGESDLTALALELGYASHSHFTDAFRAAFGVNPSSFRREAAGRRS